VPITTRCGDQCPVGFLNSAAVSDLRFHAAGSYWLMRPPSTGRRRILRGPAEGQVLPGVVDAGAALDVALSVVVRGVDGQHPPEVSFSEDQHSVGELSGEGQHEASAKRFARGIEEESSRCRARRWRGRRRTRW